MFHFCYGDSNHRHVVEPTDMADMVEMANRLTPDDQTADPADPYAGAARPLRRRLFCAAHRLRLQARRPNCAWAWCTTPTASPAPASGSRRRKNSCRISRSPPNAVSAGGRRRRSRNCCAFMPRWLGSSGKFAMTVDQTTDQVAIRPLRIDERAAWEPLWKGYLDLLRDRSPPTAPPTVTWARLHDPGRADGRARRLCGRQASAASCTIIYPPLVLDGRRLLLSAGPVRGRNARGRGLGRR